MFSRLKHQLPTFLPLGAGLLIVGLLTVLGGLWNYQNELNSHLSNPSRPVLELAAQKESTGKDGYASNASSGKKPGDGPHAATPPSDGQVYQAQESSTPHVVTASPGASSSHGSSNVSIVSLTLSVNGQVKGSVRAPAGSTQCDVLDQALSQGVIHSLNMRYSTQYGTEAVYEINNIGEPDVVWWTYTVNGNAPPYGCGYMTAHDGDYVNWRYIKG